MLKFYFEKIKSFFGSYEGKLFFLTFSFHVIFIILLNYGVIKIPSVNSDYLNYHDYATRIAILLHSGHYTLGAVYGVHWYPFFVGIFYFLSYPSLLLGTSLNALLIAFSALVLFKIIGLVNKTISENTIFWISFITMNLSASLMYNSSFLYKDPMIIFLVLAGIYTGLRVINNNKTNWLNFALFLFLFVLLFYLRFFIAYAILIGFFFYWFANNNFAWKKRILDGIIMIILFHIIVFSINNISITDHFKFTKENIFSPDKIVNPSFIKWIRDSYFRGGESTTNINVVEENVANGKLSFSFKAITKSALNTMFGPFPWQFSFKKYFFIFPDVLVWILALLLAIWGATRIKLQNSAFFLVSFGVIIVGLIMGSDNLGALLRYRLPAFVILPVIASFGIAGLQNLFLKLREKIKSQNSL